MSDLGNDGIDLTARALANAAGVVAAEAFENGPMHLTVGGTVDAITAPFPAGVTALADMQAYSFEATGANTGAVTLNIGGTGAKPLILPGGAALVAGDISAAGYVVECFYVLAHDHYHAQIIRQPSTSAPSDPASAAAVGVSTRYARADHTHKDLPDVAAGTVYAGNSMELSTPSTGAVELFNFRIIQGGTIKTYFRLNSNNAGGNAYARIYKNGVAHGALRTVTSNNYITFTEDLVFAANDTMQIFAYCSGSPGATLALVKEVLFGATRWIAPPQPLTIAVR